MTSKTVTIKCKNCKEEFTVAFKSRNQQFCSRNCVNLFQRGPNNPAYSKTYRTKKTHPEWADKTSKTHKERGHIKGSKNPMKNKETATKMSKTRKDRFKNDLPFKEKHAQIMREAWKSGKYDGVKVGQCKWFDVTNNDVTYKVQGKWELAYANWLIENNVKFKAHRGRLAYIKGNVERSYYPDFYLIDEDVYVEIKNRYHHSLNEEKLDLVRANNPDIKIRLLFKKDLEDLGIIL